MTALFGLINLDTGTWGVFAEDSQPVALADSVLSFEYHGGARQSNYPVEQGGFGSYNKVQMPYSTRVRLTKGGTDQDRQDFLKALQAAKESTNLYHIVTPDTTYINADILDISYQRTASAGACLLSVDLYIEEVRIVAEAQYSNTKAPSGASKVSMGTVQPGIPSTQQSASAGAVR